MRREWNEYFNKDRYNLEESYINNGLKILSVKMETNIPFVAVVINAGNNQCQTPWGVPHFVEHMIFKGTKNRNYEELTRLIEDYSIEANAFTAQNATAFHFTSLTENFDDLIEVVSDMIINSEFREGEMDRERGVIISEYEGISNSLSKIIDMKVHTAAYRENYNYCMFTGDAEAVNGIKRDYLLDFYKRFYTPKNAEIIIACRETHDEMRRLIGKCFGNWRGDSAPKQEVMLTRNDKKFENIKSSMCSQYVVRNVFSFPKEEFDYCKFTIFSVLLQNKLNSTVREEKGLCYSIGVSYSQAGSNVTELEIQTSAGGEILHALQESINEVLDSFKAGDFDFSDRERAVFIKKFKASLFYTYESTGEFYDYLIYKAMDGEKPFENLRVLDIAQTISKEELMQYAVNILKDQFIFTVIPN